MITHTAPLITTPENTLQSSSHLTQFSWSETFRLNCSTPQMLLSGTKTMKTSLEDPGVATCIVDFVVHSIILSSLKSKNLKLLSKV